MRYIGAIAIAIGSASTAHAGWQSTQWGMTRDQVRKVMPIRLTAIRGRNPSFSSPDLVGRYSSAAFEFEAWLQFSKRGGLAYVDLRLSPPNGCAEVLASMKARYGKPRRPVASEQIYEWTDRANRNQVALVELDDKHYAPTLCSISYSPLAIDQAGGL